MHGEHRFSVVVKTEDDLMKKAKEELISLLESYSPKVEKSYDTVQDPVAYEVSLPDIHYGKYTGQTLDEAEEEYMNTVKDLVAKADGLNIERIVLPIGNDGMNSEGYSRATTKGTPQQDSADWQETFVGYCNLMVRAIRFLSEAAPVDVVVVQGNHDYERMFYAGEYFRHAVIANGRPCDQDLDCQSQDYVCIEGACRDPNQDCRLNLLFVFTDGKESTHPLIDEFFNPVVQARRLKFGLKCETSSDCLANARCDDGFCRREVTLLDPCVDDNECPDEAYCMDGRCTVPGFLWPTDQGRCAQAGNPCIVTENPFPAECAGFFEACEAVEPFVEDPVQGANHLRDDEGNPISITTHVINVNDEDVESRLIASHGGGLHFRIDLNQEETLVRVLSRLVDYKRGGSRCSLEE